MFTGQTKSKRPATFGILYQVVACSVVADSCEGTVVQVGSTAVGEGVSLVSLKDGLIDFDRHAHWIWLRAHNEPEAPDTSL